jgi:imidazolonepropionase-like amidohydrolase
MTTAFAMENIGCIGEDGSHRHDLLALAGGTIIDGNGGPPIENGVVLIEGKRILAVGPATISVPAQARKLSVAGQFVMPGMMDANVHLFMFTITPGELIRYEQRYEELIGEAAEVALSSGLTTVFDTWGPREALTHIRDEINQGKRVGTRIFFGGNIIGLGGPTSIDFFPQARQVLSKREADEIDSRWEQGVGPELLWMTPEAVRTRVRDYLGSGRQDFLKYAGSGHAATHFSYITFSEEIQRIIVDEGHRAGMTVQAHTTSPTSLRMEIDAGADLLQHPDLSGMVPIPEEILALITDRQLPCASLFCTRRYLAWSEAHLPEPFRSFNRVKHENHRRLVTAGAQLLLTSDSGVCPACAGENPLVGSFLSADDSPLAMGEAHFRWLEAAAELGMRPMDSLMAATRNVARAYKVDKNLGTLEKGKNADVLVLDKNPLQNATNYRSIRLVIKDGAIIDRHSLPTHRILTARTA